MFADSEQLSVMIAHSIPGRLRLRLSHPPRKADKTQHIILGHPGVQSAHFTAATLSLLVCYDPGKVDLEEIILRTALCLSVDYHIKPIIIKTSASTTPLSALSIISGFSIFAAHMLSVLSSRAKPRSAMNTFCGLATTAAVSEHIYLDFITKGGFHPEVLSIGYLLSSFLRGNILKGATTAWIMTFARHLLDPPANVLKLEAKAAAPSCHHQQCEYEAKISKKFTNQSSAMATLSHLPHLLLGMYTDRQLTAEDRIFKAIQKVSSKHNDVLEGLENLQKGIRLHIES